MTYKEKSLSMIIKFIFTIKEVPSVCFKVYIKGLRYEIVYSSTKVCKLFIKKTKNNLIKQ